MRGPEKAGVNSCHHKEDTIRGWLGWLALAVGTRLPLFLSPKVPPPQFTISSLPFTSHNQADPGIVFEPHKLMFPSSAGGNGVFSRTSRPMLFMNSWSPMSKFISSVQGLDMSLSLSLSLSTLRDGFSIAKLLTDDEKW